jgi:hypothetical protein
MVSLIEERMAVFTERLRSDMSLSDPQRVKEGSRGSDRPSGTAVVSK